MAPAGRPVGPKVSAGTLLRIRSTAVHVAISVEPVAPASGVRVSVSSEAGDTAPAVAGIFRPMLGIVVHAGKIAHLVSSA